MKKSLNVWLCLLAITYLISPCFLQANDTIISDLFVEDTKHIGKRDFVEDAVFFSINQEVLDKLYKANLQSVSLTIPFENGKELILNLEKNNILGPNFKALIQKDNIHSTLSYSLGLFYKGTIYGIKDAFVAINIFEDKVTGVLAVNNQNYNIGRYDKEDGNSFVLYRENNLNLPNPFECSTEDPEQLTIEPPSSSSRSNADKKVSVYIECDYHLYKNMGNNATRVMDFTTGLFNVVTTLYQQESINIEISEIKLWSTPDPYLTSSAKRARNDFATKLNGNFNGDIAHLLSNYKVNGVPPNGGSANIDVLCNKQKAVSYTNITTSYLNFPTFSWTAYAVTHEIGHNLGSPHTHSCLWPTGPIDNCWCPEGNCAMGPEPASSGTMMSYCHLDPKWTNACSLSSSNPGINFAAGFGRQPGNLIRSKVEKAACLKTETLVPPLPISASVEVRDESCSGTRDGTAIVTVQNGQAPYKYRWSTGATTNRLSNLPAATYTVTVTDQSGNTATATEVIKPGNLVQVDAGTDKVLTCSVLEVQLTASSSTSGSQYRKIWKKQEGVISGSIIGSVSGSTLRVTEPGTYVYTVTHIASGCSSSDQVVVTRTTSNTTITITGNRLTCNQPTVQLIANTSSAGIYQWMGPNGFVSSAKTPSVDQPGLYQLSINNGVNCFSTGYIRIESAISPPQVYAIGGTLDCLQTSLQLQGSSNVAGNYFWTGPNGFSSNQAKPFVTIPGLYILVVKDSNGCSNTAKAEVRQSLTVPNLSVQGGELSCSNTTINLRVQSNDNSLRYNWVGPNGFSSTQQNPAIIEAGNYTVIATANNGCKSSKSISVTAATDQATLAIQAEPLSCNKTSTYLRVISSSSLNAHRWSGPNGYTSTASAPKVNQAGVYTLTAWGENGCPSTASFNLGISQGIPDFTLSASTISCSTPTTFLEVSELNNNHKYSWVGPNNFTSSQVRPQVNKVGLYTLTLSNNDCTASKSIVVEGDLTPPIAELAASKIGCESKTAQLSGRASKSTDRLLWTGPNGFSTNQSNPEVQIAGTYQLTVIGENGCSTTETIQVKNQVIQVTNINVQNEFCGNNDGSIKIEMANPTDNYTVQWSSGSTGLYLPAVPAGTYTATVSNSGCSTSITATVQPASDIRLVATEIKEISCYNAKDGSISITPSGGQAPYKLLWSNGQEGGTNTQLDAGIHSLEIEDAKGCIRLFYFDLKNPDPIDVIAEIGDTEAEFFVSGGQPGYQYQWSNGLSDSAAFDLENGDYEVTITDENDCRLVETFAINSTEVTENSVGQVVATNENTEEEKKALLSPNPADTYVNLYHDYGRNQLVFISIFNAQGYYLYRKTLLTVILEEQINTSSWDNGTYYVQLLTVNGFMTEELKVIHN